MQYNALQYIVMQCGAIQCDAVQLLQCCREIGLGIEGMEGRRERRRWGARRDRAGTCDAFIAMSKLKLSWTVLQLTDVQICAVLS
jgi:hypothetical protein